MNRKPDPEPGPACCECVDHARRRSVGLLLATGLVAALADRHAAADEEKPEKKAEPEKAPPQPGDEFVFAKGASKGKTVAVADLATVGTLLEVWAKDPASGAVRSKSRLNRVLLLRLDPASLDEATAKRSAEGIVAYSGFCTHAGCFIENYRPEEKVIFCHCHSSMFDPATSAKVVGGPAKAPLAALPVRIGDGKPLVAGEFEGKLGVPKAT